MDVEFATPVVVPYMLEETEVKGVTHVMVKGAFAVGFIMVSRWIWDIC